MNAVTYAVTYKGPTDSKGSRWNVRNMVNGARRTVPYGYAVSGAMAEDAVRRAFPDTAGEGVRLLWSGGIAGQDTRYVVALYGE